MTWLAADGLRAQLDAEPLTRDAALALRARVFRRGAGDADAHDDRCRHVVVRDGAGAVLLAARVWTGPDGSALPDAYVAQCYDVATLAAYPHPVMEIGRLCRADAAPDVAAATLRLFWRLLAAEVRAQGTGLLCGAASLPGADPARHAGALAALAAAPPPPPGLSVGAKEASALRLRPGTVAPDAGALPPLLRFYLGLGACFGEHVVIDRDLDTLHVFAAVEVARIPAARARLLFGPMPAD